ncbi:MAG TPA: glycosyltransferase family 39 protein [Geobacteraceae bacterium]
MRITLEWLTGKERPALRDIPLLLVVFGFAFFQSLGRFPLIEPDEGRYAEIPREMLERCDFITPLLNHVKYFEKPPLHYWLTALSMSIFGQNEFAARFAGASMGLVAVILTYHAGRKLFGRREGLCAALILGTCNGFLVQARLNITDMTLTCTLSAALAFFIVAAREGEKRKGLYYHASYVCAGLAVLAKGLIGIVFPGAIVFLWLLLARRWRCLKEMRLATGIPLFLAVTAPWFVLVSLRNPEFARFFFIHEHFERFTSTVHGRYQPFWFFVPVLLGTMLPWSLFIPAALRGTWRERLEEFGESRLYLAIWAVFIFLFFSKSNSKLVPYILPVFPPLALLMGHALARAFDGELRPVRLQAYLAGGILAILGGGLILYPHLAPKPAFGGTEGALMGLLFLGEGALALISARRANAAALVLSLVLFSYLLGLFAPSIILSGIAERKSSKELALQVGRMAGPDAVVASFGYEQGLPFYTGRRVVVVGDRSELDFGSRQGDQSAWFIDLPTFRELWDGSKPVFALLSAGELAALRGTVKAPIRPLGENRRKVLISNR